MYKNKVMVKKENEQAVTLITLIITKIVLLILAGVTLSIVLNKDGIVDMGQKGVGEYRK